MLYLKWKPLQTRRAKEHEIKKVVIVYGESQNTHLVHPFNRLFVRLFLVRSTFVINESHENPYLQWNLNSPQVC
jgi:hypothetical protein